ncbi:MAG: helix-turn-helix domain-containing protein [Planctomycetota bacterium]
MLLTPRELDELADAISERVAARLSSRPVDGLIDKREAAELLGCSIPTVERLTRSGSIPSHRVGKLRRYRASELLATKKGGRDD